MDITGQTRKFRVSMIELTGLLVFGWGGSGAFVSGGVDVLRLALAGLGLATYLSVRLWGDHAAPRLHNPILAVVSLPYLSHFFMSFGIDYRAALLTGAIATAFVVALPVVGAEIYRKLLTAQMKDT
ncbi:hypothetical protein [Maricaulis maris]|uniref:hypothetical protein n=1 Tax=Maricaulis maris TaxID=74318 RepID=UPI003B8D8C50